MDNLEHLEEEVYARYWDATTPRDVKALTLGQANSESPSAAFGACDQKRADNLHEEYLKTAKILDAKLGTHADATGPVEIGMNFYNLGRVSGFVVSAFGGASMQVRDLADLFACELNAEHLALFDGAMNESKQMFTQQIRRSIGLAVHRGWAKLLLGRCRDLAQDPRQPRTYTRETDENAAEAHEYFHFHQTCGRGGRQTRQVQRACRLNFWDLDLLIY